MHLQKVATFSTIAILLALLLVTGPSFLAKAAKLTPREDSPLSQAAITTIYTVNTAADSGDGCPSDKCALREAIAEANAHSGKDTIAFDIGCLDAPIPIIGLQSPLPDITDPIIIDGTNSENCPLNPWLSGNSAGSDVWGLTINAGDSEIKNMWITGFSGGAIKLQSSGENVITASLIYQNPGDGITVQSDDNSVTGNSISRNGANGISILSGSSGNTISENLIANNNGLGIDLNDDGVTSNDDGDGDGGGNNLQNFPIVNSLQIQGSQTTLAGSLNSTPNTRFKLEFFSNNSVDPSAYGEGETFLGSTETFTNGDGQATFQATLDGIGRNVTATATNLSSGDTSEFSPVLGSKDVSPTEQDLGKKLYYTFELRGAAGAGQASLTDPIPENAVFTPGSLWASAGAPLPVYNEAENRVTWSGNVAQGATVRVRFAVTATCGIPGNPPPPEEVRNEATIEIGGGTFDTLAIAAVELPPKDMTILADAPADHAIKVPIETADGQGPLLQWHDQQAGMQCGTDPNSDDVFYRVYLRERGQTWQEIGSSPNCDRQIQLAKDALSCQDNGDPAPYEWKVLATDPQFTCREPVETISHFVTGSCQPEITVQPKFSDYFLSGIGVNNTYRVEVTDWNGEAYQNDPQEPFGEISFDLNDVIVTESGEDWGAEHDYDMGQDFRSSLLGGENTLRIKAINDAGYESLEETLEPFVFPLPAWITTFVLGDFEIDLQALTVKYAREVEYPDPHFEAQTTVPGWVPYVGGAEMGILETYAAAGAEACSDGSGMVSLSGNTGVQVTSNKKVTGNIYGEGTVRLGQNYGLDLTEATFGLGIHGEIAEEMGIADLVPALKAAEGWPVIGRLVGWLNQRATVEAAIGPGIEIKANFKDVNDVLEFDSGTGTGLIDMSLTLSLEVIESLKASLTGGGTPRVVIQVPQAGEWGYLKEVAIRIYVKAVLTAWSFEEEWERGVTCSLPFGGCAGDQGTDRRAAQSSGWQLVERDYVTKDYATFTANEQINALANLHTRATTETQIVSNVFPLANPALAIRTDDERMLLWIHDDDSKAAAQGEEIMSAHWNGISWTSSALTADTYQDYSPQVAFDADGDAVAVWERSNVVHISPTLSITYAQAFEIASARWDSATQSWSNPVTLTNNSLLDSAPQLARGQDGTLMALWRSNDGDDLIGNATHPLTLTYAPWDSDSHTFSPTAALTNLSNTLKVDLAVYSATKAALVLSRDSDGLLTTTADSEIAYSTYDGATWSALVPLTSDAITATAPALSYNNSGQPVIVWLRDDPSAGAGQALVMQTGWTGSPMIVRPGSTSGAFLDFDLLPDPDGNLALLWQKHSHGGTDAAYAVYDETNDSWGADNTLMSDSSLDESFAPAFAGDGTLHIAYNKVAMDMVTTTVKISSTLSITVTNIPQARHTDLYFLSHTIGRDLGISDGDIALSTPNPTPGSAVVISATVHNLGDLAVSGGELAFYDGDPGAGGVQIGLTQTLTLTFRAATADTVSVTWNVPAGAVSHALYVLVDPANSVSESDEDNNQAALNAVQPDLSVAWVHSFHTAQTITLTAAISNTGHVTASAPFSIAFRATHPLTGALLGAVNVDTDLGAGEQVTTSLALDNPASWTGFDDPLQTPGGVFWAVADAGDVVDEADETNNADYAALGALPDLALAAADIRGNGPISVTVHNKGVMTASNAALSVRQNSLSGTLVYSDALDSLAAGGSQVITLDLSIGRAELWAKVDPNNDIAESDEGNNLAVRDMILDVAPLTASLSGPLTAALNTATTFSLVVAPPTTTLPITTVWRASGGISQTSLVYSITESVAFTWTSTGTKTVVVTASNHRGEAVSAPWVISVGKTIDEPPGYVYLPLVLK